MSKSLTLGYLWRARLRESIFVPATFCDVSVTMRALICFLCVYIARRLWHASANLPCSTTQPEVSQTGFHTPTPSQHFLYSFTWSETCVFFAARIPESFARRSVVGNGLATIIPSLSTDCLFRSNPVCLAVWDGFVASLNRCWAMAVSPCRAPPWRTWTTPLKVTVGRAGSCDF